MIEIETKFTGNLGAALERMEKNLVEKKLLSGVAVAAAVIYEEMKKNASPPRIGRKTGNLEKSIYRAYLPDKSKDGKQVYVVGPRQSQAPHWRLLEYGTSKMAPRQFIRPSADHLPRALAAGVDRMKDAK